PVMWLGMLAGAVGQLAPVLAVPFNAVNSLFVAFVEGVAEESARVPGASLALGLPGLLGVVVGYAALAAGWLGVRIGARFWRVRARHTDGLSAWHPRRGPSAAVGLALVAA